jgi:hypothetical protein
VIRRPRLPGAGREAPGPLVPWTESEFPRGRRDALIGGGILVALGATAGTFGFWALGNQRPDPGNDLVALGTLLDQVIVVLAAVLVALGAVAARGGRLARRAVGTFVAIIGVVLVLVGLSAWPGLLFAVPFVVSAFLLLRSESNGQPAG